MNLDIEVSYGLSTQRQEITGNGQSEHVRELYKFYKDRGMGIQEGTLSIEQFAIEQTARDLVSEARAEHDPLTGLSNRLGFIRDFDTYLREFSRTLYIHNQQDIAGATPGCLVLADLDNFGIVNTTRTHAFGDDVLRQVSQTLTSRVRPGDPLSRYGGEEFLIFLAGAGLENAGKIVERIRTAIPEETADNLDGLRQTASFGIVEFPSNLTQEDIATLTNRGRLFTKYYKLASQVERFAKNEGKNRTAIYTYEGNNRLVTEA